MTYGELIRDYVAASPFAVQARRNAAIVCRFAERFDELSIENLQRFLLDERADGCSLKTLANHRAALGKFCKWLRDRGHIPHNPVKLVELAPPHEPPPLVLSREDTDRICVLAREAGIYTEVALALYAGLRVGEIRRLQWHEVNLAARTLTVTVAKGRRPRVVPVAQPLAEALAAHLAAAPQGIAYLFPTRVHVTFRDYQPQNAPRSEHWYPKAFAPITRQIPTLRRLPRRQTGRCWHALRHTFASRAIAGGVEVYDLMRWMGHRDIKTTERYVHLLEKYDPAIERVV